MLMRSAAADARDRPVENLATNPSFERAVAGSTIVRRNLMPNPAPVTATGYVAIRMSQVYDAGGFLRLAVTDPTTVTNSHRWGTYPDRAGGGVPAVAGRIYAMSMEIRPQKAHRIRTFALRYDGSTLSVFAQAADIEAPAGVWTRVGVMGTAPIGTTRVGIELGMVDTYGREVGEIVDVRRTIIEERPSVLPYFDGATSNDRGIAFAWEGEANASPSVARAAVVEVARNLMRDPGGRGTVNVWGFYSGNTGSGSTSFVPAAWSRSGMAARATWTGANGDETVGVKVEGTFQALPSGQTYTIEYDIVTSGNANLSDPRFGGSSTAGFTIDARSPAATTAAGVPMHMWATFTTGTGADARIGNRWFTRPADGWAEVSNVVIYAGARNPAYAYWDGSITPDADLTPAWTGAENASPSVLYGVQVGSVTLATSRLAYMSWQLPGRTSLRIPPFSNNPDSFASPGGDGGAIRLGIRPGRTYTIMAKFYQAAIQPSSGGQRREMQLRGGNAANAWGSILSVRAENIVGLQTVRLVATVPADAVAAFLRLYNGGVLGEPDAWWDDLVVIEGVYDGPYIDGDMPGVIWRGSPHDSPSVGYAKAA